jgi:hypothetical protein
MKTLLTRLPFRSEAAPPTPNSRNPVHRRPVLRWQSLLVATVILATGGCETQPVMDAGPGLPISRVQALEAANDWEKLAETQIGCNDRSDACAEAHATRADACLRLAIQLPLNASAERGRTRKLLDRAESSYRKALKLQKSSDTARVASYQGGLLLTLSERRNRLDASVEENKLDRENQKLLKAAAEARSKVPDSALGYIYGASAHVYNALLKESGRDRCDDLRQAAIMLKRSPPPPRELSDDEQRLQTLVERELRQNRCNQR